MRASLILLALLSLVPIRARASGEAGAAYVSRMYRIEISSGVRKILADGNDSYFEDEARSYRAWLSPVVREIDTLVDEAAASLRILPYAPDSTRQAIGRARLRGERGRISLRVCVSASVPQAGLDALAGQIARRIEARRPRDGAPAPNLVALEPVRVDRPGLRLLVGPSASHAAKPQLAAVRAAQARYAKKVEREVVRVLTAEAEALGLPAGWPQQASASPDLGVRALATRLYLGTNEISFEVPLAVEVDDQKRAALRRTLSDRLDPER